MRIIVLDLDGTLIPGNSFRRWLVFLAIWMVRSREIGHFYKLASAIIKRLVRATDHAGLKRAVLVLSTAIPEREVDRFGAIIAATIRDDVRRRVMAEGLPVAIVTAAPALYLQPVKHAIPGAVVLATPARVDKYWAELTGEAKWQRLVDRFGAEVEIEVVYTDHPDDLPLLRRARRGVIVSPRPKHWNAFRTCGVPVMKLERTDTAS